MSIPLNQVHFIIFKCIFFLSIIAVKGFKLHILILIMSVKLCSFIIFLILKFPER